MIKHIIIHSRPVLLVISLALCLYACKKDAAPGAPPTIEKVTDLTDRNTALGGATYSQWILIKGSHLATTYKVDFNGTVVSDTMLFANDTSVTVKVPGPLAGVTNNPITVFTKYGQATIDFVINQPAPTITSFDPVSGSPGDIVTITGDWFTNLVNVRFGADDAEIVSSSQTEIRVKVPANVSQAYIFVTTSGGTTQSANAYGFKFIVYDDEPNSMFWIGGGWGGVADLNNTTIVKRGAKSVKISYAGGYGSPLQLGGGTLDLSTFTAVKISIYGGDGVTTGNKVKLVLNGNATDGQELILVPNQWTDFTIPLNTLGSPAILNEIWLQEFSNTVSEIIYVDDFGLI